MTRIERVQGLLCHNNPIFTPSNISAVAEECGITYEKALWFLGIYQNRGDDVYTSLRKLIGHYRPDLIASDSIQHTKAR